MLSFEKRFVWQALEQKPDNLPIHLKRKSFAAFDHAALDIELCEKVRRDVR